MPNRTSTSLSPSLSAPAPAGPRLLSGPAPILLASVLWGSTGTTASFAPAGARPISVGAAGLVLGGLLLLLTRRDAPTLPRRCDRSERWLCLLGALGVVGYPVTFYPAVARAGVAVATVVALGSAPVFTGLLAWLTGQARPTVRWCLATAGAVAGCTLLVLGPDLGAGAVPVDLLGVGFALVAGLSYAVYALVGGSLIARGHGSDAVLGAMFGGAAVLAVPVLVATGVHWVASPRGAAVALYLGVVTTFLAYRLFGRGLRRTGAQVATTLTLAEPAVAAVLGVVVLGERLPLPSCIGLAVLAASIAALARPTRRRATHRPAG
ncbi:DME family drug/metabolite transporter [Streptacidiphilus sp. MAP12-33]|uniref:DMT family transporter n=1 Tax=Streptacidiphilus sp. MAP12-33 TaxID=3156266 RepID=UPI003513C58C